MPPMPRNSTTLSANKMNNFDLGRLAARVTGDDKRQTLESMEQGILTKVLAIKNRLGLHARAAAMLVQTASKFEADIKVCKDGQVVDARSILGLLMLAAAQGSFIEVTAQGPDAEQALAAIEELVSRRFDEDE